MVNNGHAGAKLEVGFSLPSHAFFVSYAPRAVSVRTEGHGPSLVNGAPQRRRSPMEGESIHVNVDEHGSYRATWSGNWLGRSLGTNVRYRRASNLAGRNVSEA